MNEEVSITQAISDATNLCQDPGTYGFDLQAGQSWIYPTNYPLRDYQYNIIEKALYTNTLVSLPTGLGKTFIAAVVMFNFYRWYPHGKVIFVAPTRPLVKQQIDACYNVMAIPAEATAELIGTKQQPARVEVWKTKRVFFVTPQVLQNDLDTIPELGAAIKFIVFDEAHKAKGNYAYCEIIRKLLPQNKLFRVLALSATPGSTIKDVLEVLANLLIAHLEFRTEESPDVKPYGFERSLETVVVPLGEKLQQVKDDYIQVLEFYTRSLIKYKVIPGNCSSWTKGRIFLVMKEFQTHSAGDRNYGEIMKNLNICVTLYHAFEVLVRHGLRGFLNFYEEHINKPLLRGNQSIIRILDDVRAYLGPAPNVEALPDGSFTEISRDTKFGHPKFYHLRDILAAHFATSIDSSRVMVFFEYRESVLEAYALLLQSRPIIRPRVFIGQASITQKVQISVVKAFREGTCNVLLSTCIGEEGLDVGEVDLIVCFDVSNKSPIRMIQRMGRTGRKREGRVVVLVTEGKEQDTLKQCLIYKNNLSTFVLNSPQLKGAMYTEDPRMVPSYITPKCHKIHITVKKPTISKNSNIKDMLRSLSGDSVKFTDDVEIVEIKERLTMGENAIDFSKHLEKLRRCQAVGEVGPSSTTKHLVDLLQFADSKRFNIPTTQNARNLKQGDIRSMFLQRAPAEPFTQEVSTQVLGLERESDALKAFPVEFFDELGNYLAVQAGVEKKCRVCSELFACSQDFKGGVVDLASWVQPDWAVVEAITVEDLEYFAQSMNPEMEDLFGDDDIFDSVLLSQFENSVERSLRFEEPKGFDKIKESFVIGQGSQMGTPAVVVVGSSGGSENYRKEVVVENVVESGCSVDGFKENLQEEIDFFGMALEDDSFGECGDSSGCPTPDHLLQDKPVFEAPRGFAKVLESLEQIPKEKYAEILSFFKLTKIDDLFEESVDLDETMIYSPEIRGSTGISPVVSIYDSPKSLRVCTPKHDASISPDLFGESPDLFETSSICIESPTSPILCTFDRMQALKAKKKLFEKKKSFRESPRKEKISETTTKPNLSKLKTVRKSSFFDNVKSDLDISDFCDLSSFGLEQTKKKSAPTPPVVDISDFCDLSAFGFGSQKQNGALKDAICKATSNKLNQPKKQNGGRDLDISDVCDISELFPTEEETNGGRNLDFNISDFCDMSFFSSQKQTNRKLTQNCSSPVKQNGSRDLDISDLCDMSQLFGNDKETNERCLKQRSNSEKQNGSRDLDISDLCDVTQLFENDKQKTYEKHKKSSEKHKRRRDLDITDFCDMALLMNDEQTNERSVPPKHSSEKQNGGRDFSINDLCDISELFPTAVKERDSKKQTTSISLSKTSNTNSVIVLSDSDPDLTPPPTSQKFTQKPIPQINQPEQAQSSSQKENSTQKTPSGGKKRGILQLRHTQNTQQVKARSTPKTTQPKSKRKFNLSLISTSEDEFEDITSPILARPKAATNIVRPAKRPKMVFNDFVEHEAALSNEDSILVSSDEESGEDCYEASFVGDETQDFPNTQMQAHYLKSVKSPVGRGRFKIPVAPRNHPSYIFSQEVDHGDDTYLNDSFVVNTEDMESERHDLSELEILEMKLKEMKKIKRRHKEQPKITNRKRIMVIDDDSD